MLVLKRVRFTYTGEILACLEDTGERWPYLEQDTMNEIMDHINENIPAIPINVTLLKVEDAQ